MRSLLLTAALALAIPLVTLTLWSFQPDADGDTGMAPIHEPHDSGPNDRDGVEQVEPVLATPEPAEPPVAPTEPTPVWTLGSALEKATHEAMASFTGRYSVAVVDLDSGNAWSYQPDERYHPASTIKMPVTLYALDQYIAGNLGWHDLITYLPQDFESPGGGAFETAPFGGLYPVENLVNRSLIHSNNVAVNMLGRHLGWENVRAFTRSIDGELFRLPDGMPEVTVMSEVGWWLHLHRLTQERPQEAKLITGPLNDSAYLGRIAAGLPDGVPFLHKFGTYAGNDHDGGIVYAERPYVLVIMTHGAENGIGEADMAIARLTAAIHAVMTGES